ncbi:MAG: hypothetical protein E7524_01175 [Ruminococcaceae bacterium]|nr:hypothetical protein [Oscillospiraceae bacterium]
MFSGTPKKLIIVGDTDTDVYCEYLSMLISVADDISEEGNDKTKIIGITDGSVDTAIWTNEIYRDNRAHTSSRQKFLFIGNKGSAKNIIPNINFEQSGTKERTDIKEDISLGIYYGWFGNKACIYIDDTLVKNHSLYTEKFRKKYEALLDSYRAKAENAIQKGSSHKKALVLDAATLLICPFILPFAIKEHSSISATENEILDQAYRYATLKFYLEYLEIFMG